MGNFRHKPCSANDLLSSLYRLSLNLNAQFHWLRAKKRKPRHKSVRERRGYRLLLHWWKLGIERATAHELGVDLTNAREDCDPVFGLPCRAAPLCNCPCPVQPTSSGRQGHKETP